ncbi:MAG: HAD hydrolase-like protein [Aureliella sp.]
MIRAIIWDFDGTIVDSQQKNLCVTRSIIKRVARKPAREFEALRSLQNYASGLTRSGGWREFYKCELGLSDEDTLVAGRLWAEYQVLDTTPTPLLEGVVEAILATHQIPMGVVSLNAKKQIENCLSEHQLIQHFQSIVGYEEVAENRQKPEPDGLLMCIRELANANTGTVLYVGDHISDILTVRKANESMRGSGSKISIISVLVTLGRNLGWHCEADLCISSCHELATIVSDFER